MLKTGQPYDFKIIEITRNAQINKIPPRKGQILDRQTDDRTRLLLDV